MVGASTLAPLGEREGPDAKRREGEGVTVVTDFPDFRARLPWVGGDLQTLRNFFRRRFGREPADPGGEQVMLEMADGDRLVGSLLPGRDGRPLVVLVHGLAGTEDSPYMRASAGYFHGLGYSALRLNMRGGGPSRATTRGHAHAGRTGDLRDALAALRWTFGKNGLLLAGYSLGGNLVLKFLAEHGAEFPILGAASVSAPIELKAAVMCIQRPRNRLYHDWLLKRLKAECLADDLDPGERRAIEAARSIYEFDDTYLAPSDGYAGAEDYYEKCKALRYLGHVRHRTLVIHARNDPWIPAAPYLGFDWASNPAFTLLLPDGGGHMGFHGADDPTPWHDRCVGAFFEGLLR